MAKIAKLLNDPRAFFLDARSSAVRVSGLWLLDRFPSVTQVLAFVGAPLDHMTRSRHTFVSACGLGVDRVFGLMRQRYLVSHGHPIISVIMPAYNAAGHIGAAIESIRNQSYDNWELVVVDDASTDDTVDVVGRWVQRDDRIRLLTLKKNAGPGVARNAGIEAASGAFIAFQDADDISHFRRLEIQLTALLRHSDKVISTCRYCRVDRSMEAVAFNGKIYRKSLISMMIRRMVIDRVGGFPRGFLGEDSEYFSRIKQYFGSDCEIHSNRVMYFASVRPDSLFMRGVNATIRRSPQGHDEVVY